MIPEGYEVVAGIDMKTFRPMSHHLVVTWDSKEESKGGIILPQDRQRAHRAQGTVIAAGQLGDTEIQVGKEILFDNLCEKEFIGSRTPGDRDPVFMMREEDVLGIVERE